MSRPPNGISIGSANFTQHTCDQIVDLSPLMAANGFVQSWPHLTYGSLDRHGSAVFAQCTHVTNTDTQTDMQTMLRVSFVTIGRIYVMHAMWSNNDNSNSNSNRVMTSCDKVFALIQFSSVFSPPPRFNIWILCFSVYCSKSLEFIVCETESLPTFRRHLKTFYFQSAHPLSTAQLA